MFAPHYQPDPRIPGFGLGFFQANLGGHLVVEHDGILPGFDAQLMLAPDDGVGVLAFANGARRGMHWLAPEVGGLLRRLLGAPDEAVRADVPHHPELWGDLCGWYRFSAHPTDPARFTLVRDRHGPRRLQPRRGRERHRIPPRVRPAVVREAAQHPREEATAMSVTTSTPATLGLKALPGADPRRDALRGRSPQGRHRLQLRRSVGHGT
jgi:hypothetical protein